MSMFILRFQVPQLCRMHLGGASRPYDYPLRWGSILITHRRNRKNDSWPFRKGLLQRSVSYVGVTQSRSRNNLEASINGAAGVIFAGGGRICDDASHGEANRVWRSGRGCSQNTAKCISGPRVETSDDRRHELMFSCPSLYSSHYFDSIIRAVQDSQTVLYCPSLRCDVLRYHTQSKASSIITFPASSGLVRVRACMFVFVFVSARFE
jgi:hypothetical protein